MSEETKLIEPIHTSCKNCVYAEYTNITQHGCSLNYLDTFRDRGITILEAYDKDKEFYVINNKKCIGYRTEEWFKDRKLDDLSIEEKIQRHHDQNYIKYLLWIDLANFKTLDDLSYISSQLKNTVPKPSQIVFIRYKGILLDIHHFDNIKQLLIDADLNDTPWRIQTMLTTEASLDEKIHDGITQCKKRFFAVILDKPDKFTEIIQSANNIVSEDMNSFNIISNENKTAFIFPISVYKYCLYHSKIELLKQNALYQII